MTKLLGLRAGLGRRPFLSLTGAKDSDDATVCIHPEYFLDNLLRLDDLLVADEARCELLEYIDGLELVLVVVVVVSLHRLG